MCNNHEPPIQAGLFFLGLLFFGGKEVKCDRMPIGRAQDAMSLIDAGSAWEILPNKNPAALARPTGTRDPRGGPCSGTLVRGAWFCLVLVSWVFLVSWVASPPPARLLAVASVRSMDWGGGCLFFLFVFLSEFFFFSLAVIYVWPTDP